MREPRSASKILINAKGSSHDICLESGVVKKRKIPGASGYLLKDTSRQKIVEAIRGTMEGKSFVDPAIAGKLLNQVAGKQTQPTSILTDKLTERELDVLRLIAKGINNSEIAAQLHLSEGTVRNHVSAILEKLNVSDRTQAAVIAIQHGL